MKNKLTPILILIIALFAWMYFSKVSVPRGGPRGGDNPPPALGISVRAIRTQLATGVTPPQTGVRLLGFKVTNHASASYGIYGAHFEPTYRNEFGFRSTKNVSLHAAIELLDSLPIINNQFYDFNLASNSPLILEAGSSVNLWLQTDFIGPVSQSFAFQPALT